MTFNLPKRTRILWQLRIVATFTILCATVIFFSIYNILFLLPGIIFATIGLFLCLVFIPLYFKNYKIMVEENAVTVTKGIIIKRSYIMPYPRLIFAQSFITPLSSAMKLKSVMLKAARGWIMIPEIESSDADFIIDAIKRK